MNLNKAINALPSTTVGITKLFAEQGIKGVPEKAELCPLAVWLQRLTGLPVHVTLTEAWVPGMDEVMLPDHVAMFVEEFDGGELEGMEALLAEL